MVVIISPQMSISKIMSNNELTVPNDITFENAIALTQKLIAQMETGELDSVQVEATVTQLVASKNGARGFFVAYFSEESPLADTPSEAILSALKTAPELVSELLVKNLAMSTAMAITHRRQHHESMAQGSDRMQRRSATFIQQLDNEYLREQLQKMRESALTGKGEAEAVFFQRWGYDEQQRSAIAQALENVIKT